MKTLVVVLFFVGLAALPARRFSFRCSHRAQVMAVV